MLIGEPAGCVKFAPEQPAALTVIEPKDAIAMNATSTDESAVSNLWLARLLLASENEFPGKIAVLEEFPSPFKVSDFIVYLLQLESVFALSRLTESCSKSAAAARQPQLRVTSRWRAIRKECQLAFAEG
jgi:hypothetical protein